MSEAPQQAEEQYVKKERKAVRGGEDERGLNINSMMDIMTILLVFLLVSITSDPLNIKQDDFLSLARSTANFNPEDSIPVTITKQAIIVDNKRIVPVECQTESGQQCQHSKTEGGPNDYKCDDKACPAKGNSYLIDKAYKEDGSESSFLIEPLFKKLEEMVKQAKEDAKVLNRKWNGVVTIVCDSYIPFRIIAEVVHSAGMAGLSDLRFAIIKAGNRM